MQRYTVSFIWKLLHMFRVIASPIIRSADNCIYSIWYLSLHYCYLPLSWKSWNWSVCAVGGVLYLETAPHVSGDTITHHQEGKQLYLQHLVFCHTVTAICRYRERVRTGLSVLWVAYATHSTLKPVPTRPR